MTSVVPHHAHVRQADHLRLLPWDRRPDLHIAWGGGNAFARSVHSTPLLDPVPAQVFYFGDLDVAGVRIAAAATQQAEEFGLGLPRPAVPFYRFLVEGPPSWRGPDRSNRPGSSHGTLLPWFPPDLRPAIADLFATRRRIPQERLGLSALHADPSLWLWLIDPP
ncbi:hypothetical protein [Embleya sp. NPDC059259]|uniref:hypothetical protein n=1 Tax=unclassified Embleya TaxID=2699296 RepID=UPI00369E09B7